MSSKEYSDGDSVTDYSSCDSLEIMYDDQFYFIIKITLDLPLVNKVLQLTHSQAKVDKIELDTLFRYDEYGEAITLNEFESKTVAYPRDWIKLQVKGFDINGQGQTVTREYESKNGVYFTVEDLVQRIIEFETVARNYRKICGSLDMNNVTFSGLAPVENSERTYELIWE